MLGFEKHTEVEKYYGVLTFYERQKGEKKENVFAICTSIPIKTQGGNPETTEIDLIQGVGRNG